MMVIRWFCSSNLLSNLFYICMLAIALFPVLSCCCSVDLVKKFSNRDLFFSEKVLDETKAKETVGGSESSPAIDPDSLFDPSWDLNNKTIESAYQDSVPQSCECVIKEEPDEARPCFQSTPLQFVNLYPVFDFKRVVNREDLSILKRKVSSSSSNATFSNSKRNKVMHFEHEDSKTEFYTWLKKLCGGERWMPVIFPVAPPTSQEYRKELLFWSYRSVLNCSIAVDHCKHLEEFTIDELLDQLYLQISVQTGIPYQPDCVDKHSAITIGVSYMIDQHNWKNFIRTTPLYKE